MEQTTAAMLEQNKAVVRRLIDEVENQGKLALLDDLVAPDFVHRNAADPDLPRGPQGLRELTARWWAAFPDGHAVVDDMIAEGDRVATRWTFRGTHRGAILGIPPTGRSVEFTGIYIDRIVDGKIVAHWDEADILGVLEQLGAAPSPPAG